MTQYNYLDGCPRSNETFPFQPDVKDKAERDCSANDNFDCIVSVRWGNAGRNEIDASENFCADEHDAEHCSPLLPGYKQR